MGPARQQVQEVEEEAVETDDENAQRSGDDTEKQSDDDTEKQSDDEESTESSEDDTEVSASLPVQAPRRTAVEDAVTSTEVICYKSLKILRAIVGFEISMKTAGHDARCAQDTQDGAGT